MRVDGEGESRTVLHLVHPGAGRAIDERVEAQDAEGAFDRARYRHVQLAARQRQQVEGLPGLPVRTEDVASELAIRAEQQHTRTHQAELRSGRP